ncbi:type VII secretion-associated protein [Mycobacterium deserti]|uniref:Type VII secretion-associated protein n=1 Tax=Mycobacterium deserti TaxID=2978347 RepID=A0ABT2M769_9MYCO|nr:type VII secretion-associated protein [Mycobacterium deserti]MCT7658115.1 type VII secretion-associated protein [Mycobacterium deserti]
MTEAVVTVGPWTIAGPDSADPVMVSVALACIDDDLALLDDRPVAIDEVWQKVLGAVAGGGVDTLVLVCPAWWSSSRTERVQAAAGAVAQSVVVLKRAQVLRMGLAAHQAAIVEIAPEFTAVTRYSVSSFIAHSEGPDAVVAAVGAARAVVLDAPDCVVAAEALSAAVGDRLRSAGINVTLADTASVQRAAQTVRTHHHCDWAVAARRSRTTRHTAVLAGLVSAAALCGGFAVRSGEAPSLGTPMALLAEGRIGVMVPAEWTVERITSGPGSARIQLVSPNDPELALHITHANGVTQIDGTTTAQSLRASLDDEPEGVFVDFNPSDRRAGRDAVTYREVRNDRQVDWTVLTEDTVRIAVGCQSAPGREGRMREICDEAIRSSRVLR